MLPAEKAAIRWRAAFIGVALLAAILPFREGMRWYRSPSRFVCKVDRVSPISAGGRLYADLFIQGPDALIASWLDAEDMVFRGDRFKMKPDGGWERAESGLPLPVSDRSASFTALRVERDGWKVQPEGVRVRLSGKTNLLLPLDGSEAYDPELGENQVFYTRTHSNRFRAAKFDIMSGVEALFPFPERRGNTYLPQWWKAGKTVFYQGVGYLDPSEKEQGFVHRLFVMRENGAMTMLPFGLSDSPGPKPYAVEGDARGRFFVHSSGFVPSGLFFYDVGALFSSAQENDKGMETRAGYSLPRGCVLVTIPQISRIQGFRLDPMDEKRLFLIGTPAGRPSAEPEKVENSRLWVAKLETGWERSISYTRSSWVALMSLLAALGALVAAFRGQKRA